MKIEADLHIHTIASGHAYSTLADVLAMEYKAPLCLNSDAHYKDDVGNIKNLLPILLKTIGVAKDNLLNSFAARTEEFTRKRRAKYYAKSSDL